MKGSLHGTADFLFAVLSFILLTPLHRAFTEMHAYLKKQVGLSKTNYTNIPAPALPGKLLFLCRQQIADRTIFFFPAKQFILVGSSNSAGKLQKLADS